MGGKDGGMDGSIPSNQGGSLPLVATTGRDVARNLEKNLESYLASGGTAREIVVATSQPLTRRQRDRLEAKAAELGFQVRNIHDQFYVALQLLRSPRWCRELLGLAGDLPALSMFPATVRPRRDVPLVGREADLRWLQQQSGDALLVGQPGSGKSYLHQILAQDGAVQFLNTTDPIQILAGIRAANPKGVIVDDAHLLMPTIRELRRIRRETGASFTIQANCWPSEQDSVARELDVLPPAIRTLKPLTMDQLVDVVKGCDIVGPDYLIQEIVNQSAGKPGLAVTLCDLCLRGDIESLRDADALVKDVLVPLTELLGNDPLPLLGALALGGNQGMPREEVAHALGLPLAELQRIVAKLAAAGIIYDVGAARLGVLPAALRHALIRRAFFNGAGSLPLDNFLALAPDLAEAIRTIMGARRRGAAVSDRVLLELIDRSRCWTALREYSWLGEDEARVAVARHPEQLTELATPGIHRAPAAFLPRLLSAASNDGRDPEQAQDHPLRVIREWITSARPGTQEAVPRRRRLLDATRAWLNAGGAPEVAGPALALVLSPAYQETSAAPGSGRTITFSRGSLAQEEVRDVLAAWPEVLDEFRRHPELDARALKAVLGAWAHPLGLGSRIATETATDLTAGARRMITELISAVPCDMGLRRWAHDVGSRLEPSLEVQVDPEFDVLFPIERFDDFQQEQQAWEAKARSLAAQWVSRQPAAIARTLAEHEATARRHQITWPDGREILVNRLAELADSSVQWATSFATAGCSGLAVWPFLRKAARTREPGWEEVLKRCLESDATRGASADVLLSLDAAPADLLDRAMTLLPRMLHLVQAGCVQKRFPVPTVRRLLNHPDRTVVGAAAIGEWMGRGGVRPDVREEWRSAIVSTVVDDAHLDRVLREDPDLAFEWLRARTIEDGENLWRADHAVAAACEVLPFGKRLALLDVLRPTATAMHVIKNLVGSDTQLYTALLAHAELKSVHLVPLCGEPNDSWIELALLALDHGYSPEQVAVALHATGFSCTGPVSRMWEGWIESFERLARQVDPRLKEVARIGRRNAEQERDRWKEREHFEAVQGLSG